MKIFLLIFLLMPVILFSQSTSFSVDISADNYGEEDDSDGSMYLTSSDLELCYDGGQQTVGIHFSSVSIPQGVTVSNCYIQFQADESQSGTGFTITIKGEDADNANSFSSTVNDVSGRTSTTASVTWNPSAWTAGDAGTAQKSPSLNSIIQEIVNRAGWAGSGLNIIITANTGSSSDHRTAEVNPTLHIEYSANTEDVLYYVSDSDNDLYKIDVPNENNVSIGDNAVTNIESIANWPSQGGYTLYAADGGNLGTISYSTGVYSNIGEIDNGGTAYGADGAQSLNDVDGLGFDARTKKLWASNRRSGDYDILFQIDPTTGHFVEDVFGSNIDYVVIDGSGVYQTFDDVAVSPTDGKIYGISNDGTSDQLVQINSLTGSVVVNVAITGATDIEGISFTNSGTLYGSSGTADELYTINKSTGAATKVSDLLGGDVEALAALVEAANIVSGTLWSDSDTDGIKDAGETTGISGVTIELWNDVNNNNEVDGGDELLQSTETDASGNYSFEYASIGNLAIKVNTSTLPSGYALTTDNKEDADFTTFNNTAPGNNFGAYTGADCDGDGIPDFSEGEGDTDGDGVNDKCDLDSDNDGIIDSDEGTKDTDGDGIKDYVDSDSDNDGIPDAVEANGGVAPTYFSNSTGRIGGSDSDGDGIMNTVDDGSTSNLENYDSDGDGYKDYVDLDSDNDGILDLVEAGGTDSDGDGKVDSFTDSNSDGYHDSYAVSALPIPNTDSGTEVVTLPNYRDIDSDGDSIDDTREGYSPADYSSPSVIQDNDGDGILNHWDINSSGESIDPFDFDSDGTADYLEQDSDNDGGADYIEGNDANGDGVRDSSPSGADVNKNGLDDAYDLSCEGSSSSNFTASGRSEENNTNGNTSVTTSSDIELTYEDQAQTVGVRFTGISIAQGTTITAASIQFEADETSSGTVSITIKGEDVDNSSAFVEGSATYDVSGRTTTTASVSWSPADWTSVGDKGSAQKTSDISSIIQEIVDRAGWSNGNAITIIFTSASTNSRVAENDPVLSISTSDGLMYDCGSDIALQDADSDTKQDWRDITVVTPVSLINFTATLKEESGLINWSTASELNNDYFIVQKSADNISFEDIDKVKGAGNSNIIHNYSSLDYNLLNGVNYYRLKQVDFDGTTTISNVVAIRNNPDVGVQVFPNPSDGDFTLETKIDIEVTIYSAIGQIIESYIFEANTINKIDLKNHNKGIYFMSYITNDGKVTKKLIVR